MHRFFLYCVDHPRRVVALMLGLTLVLAALAVAPSVSPKIASVLNPAKVDTDPENMLPASEPVRVFHREMKKELNLYDMVVVGVVNNKHPEGVFNPESLKRIYDLTQYAKTLTWPDAHNPEKQAGVVEVDIMSPATVDSIEQGGAMVKFEWLMQKPPATQEAALDIRRKAMNLPFLKGTLVSDDGKALALYLPLTDKHLSYKVASALQEKIREFDGDDEFHITGLPVAEDTFGVEMFVQMAVSAPMAMLIIFLLMLYFFRKLTLIISPMIVAMVCVIQTMGLLVVTGNTIHIMSSMIPIFIMPIAVLDAIHILSEFFDRYQETRDRRQTIVKVMETLFMPMLYTSLTTAVGFASLALTPIPPVQIFGLFVAFGVLMAWVWTVAFIPAAVMLIKEDSFANFGLAADLENESHGLMSRVLARLGAFTYARAKLILLLTICAGVAAYVGITKIVINDNPIKWFEPSHPIRVADAELNKHFGGTYMGYLAFEPDMGSDADPLEAIEYLREDIDSAASELADAGNKKAYGVAEKFMLKADGEAGRVPTKWALFDNLKKMAEKDSAGVTDFDESDVWTAILNVLGTRREIFKRPEVLKYIEGLQAHLLTLGNVGKSNSLADLVKTVYRELIDGKPENFRIPATQKAVAQTILQYQGSHRPDDLWHFVTPDYRKLSVWVQLKSGDNRDMEAVVRAVDKYVAANPPPVALRHRWFGLTYINVVWQDKMVSGMLQAFLGSFLIVLLMMIVLFRSALWGILSMIPLTVTIGLIYGAIGFVGKDYDMPVAVLSSLSLGLAVDYAIHFLARSRELHETHGDWREANALMFGEPARAITRNVLVVGVGFLPLLAAPLVPYQTVGVFIAAILVTAGAASLLILPAMIRLLDKYLFAPGGGGIACKCGTCFFAGIVAVLAGMINIYQFVHMGWTMLCYVASGLVVAMLVLCCIMSRRKACRSGGDK